jgi:hypothetical protein
VHQKERVEGRGGGKELPHIVFARLLWPPPPPLVSASFCLSRARAYWKWTGRTPICLLVRAFVMMGVRFFYPPLPLPPLLFLPWGSTVQKTRQVVTALLRLQSAIINLTADAYVSTARVTSSVFFQEKNCLIEHHHKHSYSHTLLIEKGKSPLPSLLLLLLLLRLLELCCVGWYQLCRPFPQWRFSPPSHTATHRKTTRQTQQQQQQRRRHPQHHPDLLSWQIVW